MHSDRKTLPYQCCYAYLKIMTLLLKNNEVQNSVYLEMLTHAVSKYYQQEGWYAFLVTELLRFQFCSLQGIRGIVVMYFVIEQEWRSLFEVSDIHIFHSRACSISKFFCKFFLPAHGEKDGKIELVFFKMTEGEESKLGELY